MSNQIIKYFFLFTFVVSFFSLAAAFYIEYILGFKPCVLCLYQRIPYALALIISLIAFFYNNKNILLKFLALTFISSILISGYHVSIENGFIEPIFTCTGENTNIIDKEEILKSLKNNTQVDCKDVNFSLFGISLATLNLINSFVFTMIIVYILKYAKKK